MSSPSDQLLQVERVEVRFEGVLALKAVDLEVRPGEILGLIGPNGAGKTTLLNAISGFVTLHAGRVLLDGSDVTKWKPHRRARRGLARSFQATRLFPDLTVMEHVEAAALAATRSRAEARSPAVELLQRIHLADHADARARTLSAGDQHRLGVLRALAIGPRYLLLDEPAAGLNEAESEELVAFVRGIRDDFGCGVLVIDHDMRVIMPLCERIQVLNYGGSIAIGTPEEIRSDPKVITAYLGAHGTQDVTDTTQVGSDAEG
jgi:branched-chain amino acid transport system ATP-binding protein